MKHIPLVVICLLSCFFLTAQTVRWTWISGDSTCNQLDVYGDRRNMDPVNKPGSVSPVNTWTDTAGNFYMFGGFALIKYFNDTVAVPSNAFWKYNPVINTWAMVTGRNGQTPSDAGGGIFGTKGVPAPDNTPELLGINGASWTDESGKLWLYGGKTNYRSTGSNGTMWKFDPVLSQWTWISGSTAWDVGPSYGTKGVTDSSNSPGARAGMISWKDKEGHFYVYGGSRPAAFANYGDVWKYSPITSIWTWVSGRQWYSGITDGPVYGTKGVFEADNTPGWGGGRNGTSLGLPDSNGIISMFISNEVWNYSVETNQWAWISGDRKVNPKPNYGIKGILSADNHPGTRSEPVNWTDTIGNKWIFGGYLTNVYSRLFLNDLWKYTVQTGQWVWVDGDSSINRPPDFGTKGITSASTQPGGRSSSVSWRDAEGNLWLFGGGRREVQSVSGTVNIEQGNDLWKLSITENNLPVQLSGFSATLQNEQVILQWNTWQEQNSKEFIIQRSADGLHFISIGIAAASGNASSISNYRFVDRAPSTGNNFYRLKQVDRDNTFEYSAVVKVTIEMSTFAYGIIQNPVQIELRLTMQAAHATILKVQVKDATGRLLIVKNTTIAQGASTYSLPVKWLSRGVYIISITNNMKIITKRFFKS